MAKWINFPVVGGVIDGQGSALTPYMDGDNLLLADSVCAVEVAATAAGAPDDGAIKITLTLTNATAAHDTCEVLIATSDVASASPNNNIPSSANYVNAVKKAVNRALTANPGGVKSTVTLPLDTADPTAAYDPALRVYFRSFAIK